MPKVRDRMSGDGPDTSVLQDGILPMAIYKLTLVILGLAVMTVAQSGCSTLNTLASKPIPPMPEESANGMYMVDFVPFVGKSTSFKGQIRGNMTVQNALEESEAFKRVRNAKITIYRIVRGSGKPLKLPVTLMRGRRQVKFEEDYALHPGDRIVVETKGAAGLDQVLDNLMPK